MSHDPLQTPAPRQQLIGSGERSAFSFKSTDKDAVVVQLAALTATATTASTSTNATDTIPSPAPVVTSHLASPSSNSRNDSPVPITAPTSGRERKSDEDVAKLVRRRRASRARCCPALRRRLTAACCCCSCLCSGKKTEYDVLNTVDNGDPDDDIGSLQESQCRPKANTSLLYSFVCMFTCLLIAVVVLLSYDVSNKGVATLSDLMPNATNSTNTTTSPPPVFVNLTSIIIPL